VAALLSLPLTRALLGQGRFEIAPIAIRTHPAAWALDPGQFARPQAQELVRFARAPLDPNPVVSGLHRADAPHAAIRHTHAISHREATAHHRYLESDACRHLTLKLNCGRSTDGEDAADPRLETEWRLPLLPPAQRPSVAAIR
jgi:hypothetical protein